MGALFFVHGNAASAESSITAETLITQTNSERIKYNLAPIRANNQLTKAASYKAKDMLRGDYFSHTTSSGKQFYRWIQESGYIYKSAGENLAISFTASEDVIIAWMNSKTHRENILDANYTEIGIAVVSGEFQGKQTIVVVQLFGEPKLY